MAHNSPGKINLMTHKKIIMIKWSFSVSLHICCWGLKKGTRKKIKSAMKKTLTKQWQKVIKVTGLVSPKIVIKSHTDKVVEANTWGQITVTWRKFAFLESSIIHSWLTWLVRIDVQDRFQTENRTLKIDTHIQR